MKATDLINTLKAKLRVSTDGQLASALSITQATLVNWKSGEELTPRKIAEVFSKLVKERQRQSKHNGPAVVSAIKKKFDLTTDVQLVEKLGISTQRLQYWKKDEALTAKLIAEAVHGAFNASQRITETSSILFLVEFFPISKLEVGKAGKFEMFSVSDPQRQSYMAGLRKELDRAKGVYVFYDSRGQAIYVGRTTQQTLWAEMTNAFNRERDVQLIKRVDHPLKNKIAFTTAHNNVRQIVERSVKIHELAHYFSAFEVKGALIEEVESILVRAFCNDLLNRKVEYTHKQKATKKRKKAAKGATKKSAPKKRKVVTKVVRKKKTP